MSVHNHQETFSCAIVRWHSWLHHPGGRVGIESGFLSAGTLCWIRIDESFRHMSPSGLFIQSSPREIRPYTGDWWGILEFTEKGACAVAFDVEETS